MFLYRRARLAQNPRQAARADARAGLWRSRARAHSCADRPRHRRRQPGRNRRLDHRRDRRRLAQEAACAQRDKRLEIRSGSRRRSARRDPRPCGSPRRAGAEKGPDRQRRTSGRARGGRSVGEIIAARLDPGDVGEDEAARRLAGALAGPNLRAEGAFTGRVNLFAEKAGLVVVDAARIAGSTASTRRSPPRRSRLFAPSRRATWSRPSRSFPSPCRARRSTRRSQAAGTGAVRVAAFRPLRVGVVSTLLPGLKPSVVAKTLRILEGRLEPAGARIVREERVAHEPAALARALIAHCARMRRAAGLRRLGDHRSARRHSGRDRSDRRPGRSFRHAGRSRQSAADRRAWALPIIGAPGLRALAARKMASTGCCSACWPICRSGAADIMGMGVGGLLMEIASRPQPRLGDG